MMGRKLLLLSVVLGLIAGTAGLLGYLRAHQKLGRPGVKVVSEPLYDPEKNFAGTNSVYLPERVLDYSSQPAPVTQVELNWLPHDTTYGRRHYRAPDDFEILVSVVLMGRDRTSIHKPQYCLTGQGWRIDQSEKITVPMQRPAPYDLPVMKLTATHMSEMPNGEKVRTRGIYVYWFVADNELTADHFQRMWWMARDLILTGTLQRWAYVSGFSVCHPGQEQATYERMKRFMAAAVPEFQLTRGAP